MASSICLEKKVIIIKGRKYDFTVSLHTDGSKKSIVTFCSSLMFSSGEINKINKQYASRKISLEEYDMKIHGMSGDDFNKHLRKYDLQARDHFKKFLK